jgi:hypothetical protein
MPKFRVTVIRTYKEFIEVDAPSMTRAKDMVRYDKYSAEDVVYSDPVYVHSREIVDVEELVPRNEDVVDVCN